MNDLQVARALGWASMGIAATEILGQGTVENDLLGVEEQPNLMYALGAREALAGAVILSQQSVTPTLAAGLWSRVAGDAMDLALLATAATKTRKPGPLSFSTFMVVGITALDVLYAIRVQRRVNRIARAARQAEARSVKVASATGRLEALESARS